MVVVRSGDGANVPDWSAESPAPPVASEITAIPAAAFAPEPAPSVAEPRPSEPAPSEPFPLARDLEPPPSAPGATDRAGAAAWEEPVLDSPELQSGSLRVAEPVEPASARVPSVTPIPSAWRTPEPAVVSAALAPPPSISAAPAPSGAPEARAATGVPERASSRGFPWKVAAPAAIAALGVLYFATRGAPEAERAIAEKPALEAARVPASPVEAVPAEAPTANAPLAAKPPERPDPEPPAEAATAALAPTRTEPAPRKQSLSGVTTKPVPPGATRVRLVVHPPDAKVGRRGVTQKPPYEFDVPKGKKIVLEVLHKGYTTRKVTLDGSSSRVVVGLTRPRSRGSR